jgi:hypothetical protein
LVSFPNEIHNTDNALLQDSSDENALQAFSKFSELKKKNESFDIFENQFDDIHTVDNVINCDNDTSIIYDQTLSSNDDELNGTNADQYLYDESIEEYFESLARKNLKVTINGKNPKNLTPSPSQSGSVMTPSDTISIEESEVFSPQDAPIAGTLLGRCFGRFTRKKTFLSINLTNVILRTNDTEHFFSNVFLVIDKNGLLS